MAAVVQAHIGGLGHRDAAHVVRLLLGDTERGGCLRVAPGERPALEELVQTQPYLHPTAPQPEGHTPTEAPARDRAAEAGHGAGNESEDALRAELEALKAALQESIAHGHAQKQRADAAEHKLRRVCAEQGRAGTTLPGMTFKLS